ncbi:hypothetical protein EJB05_01097, partial [Eragrostis curvula]
MNCARAPSSLLSRPIFIAAGQPRRHLLVVDSPSPHIHQGTTFPRRRTSPYDHRLREIFHPGPLHAKVLVTETLVVTLKVVLALSSLELASLVRNAAAKTSPGRLLIADHRPALAVVNRYPVEVRAAKVSLSRPHVDPLPLSRRRNGRRAAAAALCASCARTVGSPGPDPVQPRPNCPIQLKSKPYRAHPFFPLTETTPEPLDFQLPEEQTQEVQEEQPQQDTDPTDPVSYAPEPGKPRCGLGYVRTC